MPSQANYFLAEVLPPYTANGLVLTMLKRYNILLRDCTSKVGFDGRQYMRIAVRSRKDNERLIAALKELEEVK
jgi:histidinol-phosphate/aromatic aminotransferase/cobyric acid decarboxylase-like protein